jgi:general secretion pathway protein E
VEHELSHAVWSQSGLHRFSDEPRPVFKAVGCAKCLGTGYRGRIAIHELMVLNSDLNQSIQKGADALALHAQARAAGMITLYEDGLRHVYAGVTTLDEVLRVTQD